MNNFKKTPIDLDKVIFSFKQPNKVVSTGDYLLLKFQILIHLYLMGPEKKSDYDWISYKIKKKKLYIYYYLI